MHKLLTAGAACLLAGAVHAAELDIADCQFPEPPTVPDGATASEAQMGQAGVNVRDFVADVQSSLQCLAAAEQRLGDEITEEQQATLIAIYNDGVDQMNTVAERYNEQVRVYKER
jgi:hypothetical protein